MLKGILQTTSLGLIYIGLSLVLGECHPFSRETMYSTFPKQAYTVYLSDAQGKLIPLEKYYKSNTNDLTHYFNTVCESMHIKSGDTAKTADQMKSIGEDVMRELRQKRLTDSSLADTIEVHEVHYFLKDDSIQTKDIVMYAASSR